jgi:hypothetical protein
MTRIRTIADYQPYQVTLSEQVKSRYCPGMRSCWSFNFGSYSPLNRPTNADTLRRVCMILTLASRTLLDVLALYENIMDMKVLGALISLVLGLISFFFVGCCLARIGDAEGERMVMRWDVVRITDAFMHEYGVRSYRREKTKVTNSTGSMALRHLSTLLRLSPRIIIGQPVLWALDPLLRSGFRGSLGFDVDLYCCSGLDLYLGPKSSQYGIGVVARTSTSSIQSGRK